MDRNYRAIRRDGWVETEATILSCKQTLLSSMRGAGLSYELGVDGPEYTVEFQYAVEQKAFTGRYVAHSERVVGTTLAIAYDPRRPERNTASYLNQNLWIRLVAWSIGIGLAALALRLGLSDVPPF